MKTNYKLILTLLLAFSVQFIFAQKTVTGTVSDDTGVLPGVNVLIQGTNTGTETDFDGVYSISAKKGDVLQFSFVGMETVSIKITDAKVYDLVMVMDDSNVLEEVLIQSAYDIKRIKSKSNIAISSIDSETIQTRPNASFVQTLQGQVAGLNINTGSGQPGSNSETLIRGVGSLSGNTEPLFVIDGMPVDEDNFRSLNPSEIASVSVLKDAGATAIYGNRGANGVVIITTHRGKFGSKMKVKYTGITSFQNLQDNKYDLMNSKEQLLLERTHGAGQGHGMSDEEINALAYASDTDWTKVFFRTGATQNHTVSITSGGDNINSFTSFGYFDQEGVLVDSKLRRFNLRNNTNGKSKDDKFTYGTNLSINSSKNNSPNRIGSGAVNRNYALGGMMSVPYLSPEDYTPGDGGNIVPTFTNTPIMLLDRLDTYTRYEDEIKFLGGISLKYKFTDELSISSNINSDFTEIQTTRAESPTSFNAVYFAQNGNDTPGFQSQYSDRFLSYDIVNKLGYVKTLKEKHTIDASLFSEYFKAHKRGLGYFAEGLDPRFFSPGDGSGFVGDNADNDWFVDTARSRWNDAGLLSFFTNIDYDYNGKYGLATTLRKDASYRFRESNRWGTFYSVSGRWNINKEKFLENSNFVNLLKLRVSYGTTGNQRIVNVDGNDAYFAQPNGFLDTYANGSGYGGQNSVYAAQIGVSDLRWEVITQANLGLDFEIFNNKLRGSLDVYDKTTTDLFEIMPVPLTSGTASLAINGPGKIVNRGIDLSLNSDVITNEDGFNLTLSLVGNYNKTNRFGSEETDVEEGGKLDQYFVYRYAGVNPINGNLLFLDINDNVTEQPNEDTDRVFLDKNRYPDYQGSFGFDSSYKNFFFTANFNYAIGIDRFDGNLFAFHNKDNIGDFRTSSDLNNAWTPENIYTTIPSLDATNFSLRGGSDMYIQNADYLRLRFASIGYNVPEKAINKLGINTLRAFMNAENYITFSKWRGFDVESAGASSQWGYPTPKILSMGVEFGF